VTLTEQPMFDEKVKAEKQVRHDSSQQRSRQRITGNHGAAPSCAKKQSGIDLRQIVGDVSKITVKISLQCHQSKTSNLSSTFNG